MTEWFNYAFKSSELDEVSRFPSLSALGGQDRDRGGEGRVEQRTEEIFALPCLRMDLKTRHTQGQEAPTKEDAKPAVDCSFVTGKDDATIDSGAQPTYV